MVAIPPLPGSFDVAREFPISRRWTFLNHAGVAPISARAAAAIEKFAAEARDDAYLTGKWYQRIESVRRLAAGFLNAKTSEIAFVKNTSEGIAFVANGLTWKPGDQVISTRVEYPSNVYPWMDLAHRLGVVHTMLPETDGRIDPTLLAGAVTPRTRMIALSHIEYASGFQHDLVKIGKLCRELNILLCIDGIQACGAVPVDVKAMNIDFLSADGHKWLLGPEGAGIFYCRQELQDLLRPEIGWMNVENANDYGTYDLTLRQDARRYECGSHNVPGILGLGASLELLGEVGMATVTARILGLTQRLATGLAAKGYSVVSSRRPGEASGIVSFKSNRHKHEQIIKDLEQRHVIIVERERRLRASPHFYNSETEIDRLLEALPIDQ